MIKWKLSDAFSFITRSALISAVLISLNTVPSVHAPQVVEASTLGNVTFLPVINGPILPSAQVMIRSALDSGKIDYSTSLLYRAYALFGGDALPSEYRGVVDEDNALIEEWRSPTEAITPAVSALLAPFMQRPDLPDSAWSQYASAHPAVLSDLVSAAAPTIPCNPGRNWASITSAKAGVNVKVWSTYDGHYDIHMKYLLSVIEGLWGPETSLMGLPIPDNGGPLRSGGTEIDFYLVNPLQSAPRPGNPIMPEGAYAATFGSSPFTNGKASAFILVPRDSLYAARFNNSLAHEIFHALQFAHNYDIIFKADKSEWWFTEASAVWAGGYFVPKTSYDGAHFRFSNFSHDDFQHSPMSLDDSGKSGTPAWDNSYLAYIWPYFIQQEKGAAAVTEIWKNLETAGTNWNTGLNRIDQALPFKENFHRFALRNLNLALQPGDPIDPRYGNLDPNFPDNNLPMIENSNPFLELSGPQDPPKVVSVIAVSLNSAYYYYQVPDSARQVTIDLPAQVEPYHFDVVVLTRKGNWQVRDLTGQITVSMCDVQELYLVASNHDTPPNQTTVTTFKIKATELPCSCQGFAAVQSVSGTIKFNYQHTASDANRTFEINQSASLNFTLPVKSVGSSGMSFYGPVTGMAIVHNMMTENYTPPRVTRWDGSGSVIPLTTGEDSIADFNVNLLDCTYNFGTTLYLMQTSVDSSGSSTTLPDWVGSVSSVNFPLILQKPVTSLGGILPFDAHSVPWASMQTVISNAFIPGGASSSMFFVGTEDDSSGGSADITWVFSALTP